MLYLKGFTNYGILVNEFQSYRTCKNKNGYKFGTSLLLFIAILDV